MFREFLNCVKDKGDNEIVKIVCGDCVMQATLGEMRFSLCYGSGFYEKLSLEIARLNNANKLLSRQEITHDQNKA